jgi:single-strand DNA-binding protein
MTEFNKVIVVGNLTKDPEVVETKSPTTSITNVRIAVNRTWKSQDGDRKNDVCFVDAKAFGKNADNIAKYCQKGKSLLIEGRLSMDEWEAKDGGGKRSKHYITVERFEFLGSPPSSDNADATSNATPVAAGGEDKLDF